MENIEIINGIPVDWSKYKGSKIYKSKKAYIEFCELLGNNGHKIIGEYVKNSEKVLIDFNCGHEPHLVSPHNYKKGNRCPRCVGNCPKQAKEDFMDLLHKNNHELLSEYIDAKKKVLIDFNCGHEPHWIQPNNYKNGTRCPRCVGKAGQAKEDLLHIIKKNGHKLLSEYKGTSEKILIDYGNGHQPYWIYPCYYKSNQGKNTGNYSYQVKEEFFTVLSSNNHILLSDYKNTNIKVLIDFNCGHEPHWIAPNHYKNGKGCPKCARNCKDYAKEDFINLLKVNGHTLEGEYVNATTKVLVNFNCGHEPNLVKPNNYKNGTRCPKCFNKGEDALHKLLVDMFGNIEWQKTYDDLKDKRLLPYDFYLPKYNLLIELDGEHHRKEMYYKSQNDITDIDEVNAYLRLCDRQRKDKLKDEYAKDNNIPLLRIEYNSKIELKKWKQLILDKIKEIEL